MVDTALRQTFAGSGRRHACLLPVESDRRRPWKRSDRTAQDYFGFIVLIGSLYVVSGGIHIGVEGEATPALNTLFLAIGGVLANVLGTTGASMLLIRPWLRMNHYRTTAHHVVFFIFIVSNVGGCLTPIGDPPLLVGFLKGVPFWWVLEHCWTMWLVSMAFLLAVFYCIDRRQLSPGAGSRPGKTRRNGTPMAL